MQKVRKVHASNLWLVSLNLHPEQLLNVTKAICLPLAAEAGVALVCSNVLQYNEKYLS